MTIKTLGIDLAKNVFQLYGAEADGGCVLQRRVRRENLLTVGGSLPPCTIGIEAHTGAFFWQRRFEALGHDVKIIAPQPFLKHQKNDRNDAEAICTALRQPNMRFVPKKSVKQQHIRTLHRARQRLVNHRTALVSQMRGILLDRGIGFGKSVTRARRMIPEIIVDVDNELTELCRETLKQSAGLAARDRCARNNLTVPPPQQPSSKCGNIKTERRNHLAT